MKTALILFLLLPETYGAKTCEVDLTGGVNTAARQMASLMCEAPPDGDKKKPKFSRRLKEGYHTLAVKIASRRDSSNKTPRDREKFADHQLKKDKHVQALLAKDEEKLNVIYERLEKLNAEKFARDWAPKGPVWEGFDLKSGSHDVVNSSNVKVRIASRAFALAENISLPVSSEEAKAAKNDPSIIEAWERTISENYPDLLGCRVTVILTKSGYQAQATCLVPQFRIIASKPAPKFEVTKLNRSNERQEKLDSGGKTGAAYCTFDPDSAEFEPNENAEVEAMYPATSDIVIPKQLSLSPQSPNSLEN